MLSQTNRTDLEAQTSASTEHISPILDKIDPTVPGDTKQQLEELLYCYSDVFSKSEYDRGCTNIIQHRIDTQDNPPLRQSLRPQPRAHLPVIDQLLNDMQQQGVIEPCNSERASNVVLVKKKDGRWLGVVQHLRSQIRFSPGSHGPPRYQQNDICMPSRNVQVS